jgi:hypothetical protein
MVLYRTSSVLLTSERADPVGTEARGANQSYPPEIAAGSFSHCSQRD